MNTIGLTTDFRDSAERAREAAERNGYVVSAAEFEVLCMMVVSDYAQDWMNEEQIFSLIEIAIMEYSYKIRKAHNV